MPPTSRNISPIQVHAGELLAQPGNVPGVVVGDEVTRLKPKSKASMEKDQRLVTSSPTVKNESCRGQECPRSRKNRGCAQGFRLNWVRPAPKLPENGFVRRHPCLQPTRLHG